nr:hypothetical protein [uncultured Desulfobacter sp.]
MDDLKVTHDSLKLTPGMKQVIVWGVILGAGAIGLSYLLFIVYWTWQSQGWVKDVIQQHFAATVGLPLAAVGAFLLVQVLQISAGQIEFEAFGLKLKGASGPVVLWVVSFLAIAAGIRLLW